VQLAFDLRQAREDLGGQRAGVRIEGSALEETADVGVGAVVVSVSVFVFVVVVVVVIVTGARARARARSSSDRPPYAHRSLAS